ncbi:MAG TPA: hypothetical protein VJ718_07715 [Candidatus Binataceae bacterium]|nr:hypothetical protein [Candidatus Binataceae bacterium]
MAARRSLSAARVVCARQINCLWPAIYDDEVLAGAIEPPDRIYSGYFRAALNS